MTEDKAVSVKKLSESLVSIGNNYSLFKQPVSSN